MSPCANGRKMVKVTIQGEKMGARFFHFAYCFQPCFVIIYYSHTIVRYMRTNCTSKIRRYFYGKSI